MILGPMLKSYRRSEKLSLRQLARVIGVGHTVLHRFENGSNITARQLTQIYSWVFTGVRNSGHEPHA